VLLCDPFGSDRMNLHASYRALALRLADAGFPALRVDYPGTCDSSGYPRDPELFRSWLASLHIAADWLKRRSGVAELSVFGALLGGTLAALFAGTRPDVSGLALWGAYTSGRAFLREAAAMRAMMTSNPEERRPSGWEPGDQESIGFLIPRAMAEQLATIDLLAQATPAVRASAVFRRGRAERIDPLLSRLRAGGSAVYLQRGPPVELAELVDQRARPPEPLLEEMVAWWSVSYPEQAAPSAVPTSAPDLCSEVTLASRRGRTVREQVVRFGSDLGLIGILTHPAMRPDPSQPAIVLVNGGGNHRPGINRNNAEWAREWAASGWLVLRIDMRGLGDSVPLRPEDLCVLHRAESRLDIRAAMDFLEQQHGARGFVCMGLCAGAYQSFHTALEDARVAGVVMLNPLRFQGLRAKRLIEVHDVRDFKRASRDLVERLSGAARVQARVLISRLRREPPPPSTWLADAFLQLTKRGCDVLLVFNAGDAMVGVVNEQLSADRARLHASGRFAIEFIDQTDHIFSPLWSQERLGQILEATLARWRARTASVSSVMPAAAANAQESP
jgi:dienelactone hydrolase